MDIGAFLLALITSCIIGAIPISVFLLLDHYLFSRLNKWIQYILCLLLFISSVTLLSLKHLPGPESLLGLSFQSQFMLAFFITSTALAGVVIVVCWWLYGILKKPYRLKARNRLAIFTLILVAIFGLKRGLNIWLPYYAFGKAEKLIAHIENYKLKTGDYPETIADTGLLHLGLISAREFRYEKEDTAYVLAYNVLATPMNIEYYVYDPYNVFTTEGKYLYYLRDYAGDWTVYYSD